MKKLLLFIVGVLAVAGVVHYVTLIQTPGFIMKRVMMKMGEENTIHHQDKVTADSRGVVRPSPDLLYSVCPFDLTNGALHVTAPVPPGTYWSVSLFDEQTNNFYVKNDKQAKGSVDLLVTLPMADVKRPSGATEVLSPTAKGLVLFRTLINDEKNFAAIDAVRRKANCVFIRSRAS